MTEVAARLADSHGDDAKALRTLEQGLARHGDAAPLVRARALLYRAELAMRLGDSEVARASLADVAALSLADADRAAIGPDVVHVETLIQQG